MAGIMDRIPGIVATTLSQTKITQAATISRPGSRTSDGKGGWIAGAPVSHDCAAIVTDYSDFRVSQSEGKITVRDRKALVAAQGLSIVPATGDTFAQFGASWVVIKADRDPAGATYELQIRPT